ncbi:hypothetical protein Acsp02_60640 [Actinoplanes sp. NBRC 103695]|nr:hypothetical protein Acsp02_60640 [Actinoplanes sp. NBRC 103695]
MREQPGKDADDRRLPAQPTESEGDRASKHDIAEAELARQCQCDKEENRSGRESRASSPYDRLRTAAGCCHDHKAQAR